MRSHNTRSRTRTPLYRVGDKLGERLPLCDVSAVRFHPRRPEVAVGTEDGMIMLYSGNAKRTLDAVNRFFG